MHCSPWGRWGSDMTEQLHFPFSLSCIGEGNGNPLQCSCLENPRDRGAWWAAVYGVAQSWTQLKRLSSSSREVGGGGMQKLPVFIERLCHEPVQKIQWWSPGHSTIAGVGKAQEEPAEEVRRSTGCGRGISGECCVQGAGEKMAPGLTGVWRVENWHVVGPWQLDNSEI